MTIRIRNTALLCLALLVVCQFAAAQTSKTKKGFDAEQVLAPWVRMWNSYDLNQVDELFVNDASVTYFSSEKPGLLRGIEALRAHHTGFGFVKGGKTVTTKLWLEDLRATAHGNVYVVTATWFFSRGDNSKPPQKGPMTFVYVPWRGTYRIAHGHFANDPMPR